RGGDVAVGSLVSYNAGTGEEAFFRGTLHPYLYENWNGSWTANAVQGTVFGFAHGPKPYFQLAAGWYFGWLNERNRFELGEGIFVHAWWDVWIITANLIKNRGFANGAYVEFPRLEIQF
ncbi:MAG: CPBP family intramembrane metalloprotease, partial [Proteobacteria bacterium]